ncbi:MAG: BCCT family transporter [Planctomycetota bacterium]
MKLKPLVFFPPCLLLVPAVILNFVAPRTFANTLESAYNAALSGFGWLVSLLGVVMLLVCAVVYASPFGRVVIGGPGAKPLLRKWNLFAVVVCVNIGIGILFWGPIEPLNYLHNPPVSLGIAADSPAAATFAISTVYLHNTVLPLSFATLVGLMFAFAYYNMRQPFTLGAPLAPLIGRHSRGIAGQLIDAVCLYALVAAMAASLGACLLLLGGGIHYYRGIEGKPSSLLLGILCAAMVIAYVVAAITGLTKGIRILANIKTTLFVLLLSFIFFFGPTQFILGNAVEGLGNFLTHFFEKALFTGTAAGDPWPHNWTQMYMSAWCAWAPLNGLFFGRIAYGYTVRTYLLFSILLPAIFMGIWMAIICGATVNLELTQNSPLWEVVHTLGNGRVMYAFMEHFPYIRFITPAFLVVCFVSLITVSAAVTSTMAGLCSTGVSPESPEASPLLKVFWGSLVGLVAWIMITFVNVEAIRDALHKERDELDGIRMLSNLAGVPTLLLCGAVVVAVIIVMQNPAKFDQFKENYDEAGNPLPHRR